MDLLKKVWSAVKPKPWEKNIVLILFFLAFISLAGFNIYQDNITGNVVKEMNKTKESYESITGLAEEYKEEGDKLYDLANNQYELNNFTKAREFCLEARDKYSKTHEYYAKEIALLEKLKEDYKDIFINLTKMKIDIVFTKYEACEYFEDAMLNYNQSDYTRGNVNLYIYNQKIALHDNLVKNYILAKARL